MLAEFARLHTTSFRFLVSTFTTKKRVKKQKQKINREEGDRRREKRREEKRREEEHTLALVLVLVRMNE